MPAVVYFNFKPLLSMAAPTLKTAAPSGAPRRVLLNTGAAPTKRVTLLGAGGQSIPQKSAPVPAPPPAAATPAAEVPQIDAAAEAAAAQAAAEAAAQAEYEKQMEEYNRQMEEYNRQMAEYEAQQAAEEAAAKAAAEAAAAEEAAKAAAAAKAAEEAAAKAAAEEAAKAAAAQQVAPPPPAPAPVPAPPPPAPEPVPAPPPAPAPVPAPPPAPAPTPKPRLAGPRLTPAAPAAQKPAAGPRLTPAAPGGAAKPRPAAGGAKPLGGPRPRPANAAPAAIPGGVPTPPAANIPPPPVAAEGEEPVMSEAEAAARSNYLEQLQAEANKVPFHKKPIFWICSGVLAVGAIAAIIGVQMSNAAVEDVELDRAKIAAVLNRSIEITQKEIETLDDARSKGVDVKCSKQDAELLLHIILNHEEKDEFGNLRYGPNTVGTAKNACVLLGLASEQNPDICNMVFKTLAANATKMHHELLDLLLERLVKANIKGVNKKLDALAKTLKPGNDDEVLSVIWKYKELRATPKDAPKVIALLKGKNLDKELENTLRAYMLSLFKKMDDTAAKQQIGEDIFNAVKGNEERLASQNLMRMLAFSCAPQALEYYKGKMEDKQNWRKYTYFFGSWQNDDIVPYLAQLRDTCDDSKEGQKLSGMMDTTIMKVLTQDRERDTEDAKKLLRVAFDNFDAPTTDYNEVLEKYDGENALKEGDAGYEENTARYKELEKIFLQRERVIKNLANCSSHEWIEAIFTDMEKDCDAVNSPKHRQLANLIRKTRKEIEQNTVNRANSAAKHESRLLNE